MLVLRSVDVWRGGKTETKSKEEEEEEKRKKKTELSF